MRLLSRFLIAFSLVMVVVHGTEAQPPIKKSHSIKQENRRKISTIHKRHSTRRTGKRKQFHKVIKQAAQPLKTGFLELNQPIILLNGRISKLQTDKLSNFPYTPSSELPKKRQSLLGRFFKNTKSIKYSPNKTSWIATSMTPSQAEQLADSLVSLISSQVPAASSTLVLAPIPTDQEGNSFVPAFDLAIRRSGFAISASKIPDSKPIRYLISPIVEGLLVRIHVDGKEATRIYTFNESNSLVATSPFSIWEVNP